MDPVFFIRDDNFPDNICLFKVDNRNTRKTCEICSKLTIKTPGRRQLWKYFTPFSSVSTVDFEQVNVSWVISIFFKLG